MLKLTIHTLTSYTKSLEDCRFFFFLIFLLTFIFYSCLCSAHTQDFLHKVIRPLCYCSTSKIYIQKHQRTLKEKSRQETYNFTQNLKHYPLQLCNFFLLLIAQMYIHILGNSKEIPHQLLNGVCLST